MDEQNRFDRVVASLLDAQLDDSYWPTASALFDDACDLQGNHLAVIRGDHPGNAEFLFGKLYKHGEPDDELEQRYIRDYFPIDDRLPRYFRMKERELVHVSSMFSTAELKSSLTYNDFLLPTGAGNSINVHMVGKSDLHVVMLLVRDGSKSDWSSEQLTMIRRLLPHIHQFVRVRQALADTQTGAISSAAEALTAKRTGIVLLDSNHRIVEVNDYARQLLISGDTLSAKAGFLVAQYPNETAIQNLLLPNSSASQSASRRGGSMLLQGTDGSRLVVHVAPYSRNDRVNSDGVLDVAYAVLIVDPWERFNVDADVVANALDLTPVQARVIAALASGATVNEIAKQSFRTEATIRWHLKQMMARFGYSSQVELIRLVLTLPGVFNRSD